MKPAFLTTAIAVLVLMLAGSTASGQTPSSPIVAQERHHSGQTIAPAFEGWAPDPDGRFRLFYSYMNRNYDEALDIPIGPNNTFDSGAADRGQPTHFLPRQHRMIFSVLVPKDFGDQKLTWSVTVRGKTEKAIASLNPIWMVEPTIGPPGYGSNKPPVVTVETTATVTLPATLTLSAAVTDDGIPRPKSAPPTGVRDDSFVGAEPELRVSWGKYRGPGQITFEPQSQKVEKGKAATKATFSAPGDYIIQLVADDGSEIEGFQCCWTNRNITVTVKPPQGR